ncbi:MAG: DUF4974 domain-containing protein [Prevotellaceae bacterium]|nr:DUF4974 domain-containing protein [Candidatus Minthosoma equi]
MEEYKNEIEMLRQAFAQGKTDKEIQMPDTEAELATFIAEHKKHFERQHLRITYIRKIAAIFLCVLMISGFAYAIVRTHFFTHPWSEKPLAERVAVTDADRSSLTILPNDTVQKTSGVVTFDNHELTEILTSICNAYKVKIQFKDEEQKHIRLHFSYDTNEKLEDVMESLNTFEKFQLKLKDNELTVE